MIELEKGNGREKGRNKLLSKYRENQKNCGFNNYKAAASCIFMG